MISRREFLKLWALLILWHWPPAATVSAASVPSSVPTAIGMELGRPSANRRIWLPQVSRVR